mmetsp:Transcript_52646/g.125770  ORF Transcript_52646/g.125770 Transcript_52646/m.125770 type:complete len:269 (+) Transcript_52646:113-919(+)
MAEKGLLSDGRQPFAFKEEPAEEVQRLRKLQDEDPIALQDAFNTSQALVEAVRADDLEEVRAVVNNAEEGEFLQAFVIQAFVIALKKTSLEMVRSLLGWGVPLQHPDLAQAQHLVCEMTDKENFSNAWRILQLLTSGGTPSGRLDINEPRLGDGWTPLCVACAEACLPLAFKLLELQADPNVVTRNSETPMGIAKKKHENDSEEQTEARGIIVNMLRHHGGADNWREAVSRSRHPRASRPAAPKTIQDEDGGSMETQVLSKTHTRFSA